MSNNPKRNHHYVPRLYLKGFADKTDSSFIWVYERGRSYNPGHKPGKHNPYRRSLRLAGAEQDFYAYQTRAGSTDFDTYENLLEQLEKPANQVLAKIRSRQTITKKEKQVFAAYISMLIKRVPRYRDRADEQWPEIVDEFESSAQILQQLDQHEAKLTSNDTNQIARIQQLRAQYQRLMLEYRAGIPMDIVLATIIQMGQLPQVLYGMKWQFLVAPSGFDYVTSDNPVFYFEQIGLAKEYSELTFPISSEIALATSWSKDVQEGFFPALPLAVMEINQRTISAATKQVYYCRDSD